MIDNEVFGFTTVSVPTGIRLKKCLSPSRRTWCIGVSKRH